MSGRRRSHPLSLSLWHPSHALPAQFRAYEGGPDTSGPNLGAAYLEAKGNATVDPRMQPAVTTYLQNWCAPQWGSCIARAADPRAMLRHRYAYGRAMGPLNYFVAGATNLINQYGVYGILYDMRVPVSYKTLAVDAVRKALPQPTPTEFIRAPPFVANW